MYVIDFTQSIVFEVREPASSSYTVSFSVVFVVPNLSLTFSHTTSVTGYDFTEVTRRYNEYSTPSSCFTSVTSITFPLNDPEVPYIYVGAGVSFTNVTFTSETAFAKLIHEAEITGS